MAASYPRSYWLWWVCLRLKTTRIRQRRTMSFIWFLFKYYTYLSCWRLCGARKLIHQYCICWSRLCQLEASDLKICYLEQHGLRLCRWPDNAVISLLKFRWRFLEELLSLRIMRWRLVYWPMQAWLSLQWMLSSCRSGFDHESELFKYFPRVLDERVNSFIEALHLIISMKKTVID